MTLQLPAAAVHGYLPTRGSKMDDDIAIKVENVSKKFSRSLKHLMLYGVKDIGRNAMGFGSNPEVLRKGEFWAVDIVSSELGKEHIEWKHIRSKATNLTSSVRCV